MEIKAKIKGWALKNIVHISWLCAIGIIMSTYLVYAGQNILNIIPIILFNIAILSLSKHSTKSLLLMGLASSSQIINSLTLGKDVASSFSFISLEVSVYIIALCIYSVIYTYKKCVKQKEKFSIKEFLNKDLAKRKVNAQARIISISLIILATTLIIKYAQLEFTYYNIVFALILIGNIIYSIWICIMAKDMYIYLGIYHTLSILILIVNLMTQVADWKIVLASILTSLTYLVSLHRSYIKFNRDIELKNIK